MQIGMIGLGRMGCDMDKRLLKGGQECVVSNLNVVSVESLERDGAKGAQSVRVLSAMRYGFGGNLEKTSGKTGGV